MKREKKNGTAQEGQANFGDTFFPTLFSLLFCVTNGRASLIYNILLIE